MEEQLPSQIYSHIPLKWSKMTTEENTPKILSSVHPAGSGLPQEAISSLK